MPAFPILPFVRPLISILALFGPRLDDEKCSADFYSRLVAHPFGEMRINPPDNSVMKGMSISDLPLLPKWVIE
jgi:hypothetical protein